MLTCSKLTFLRTLIMWSMASSDTVKSLINQAYKQNRQEDDLNQPRSVQSWGNDGDKRRYFLVEGQDDTNFRIYRESNPAGTNRTWWSVAGSIEEVKALAEKLEIKDGGPKAKNLAQKMLQVIPRFEAGEEVSIQSLVAEHRSIVVTFAIETQATRISPDAKGAVQTSRARVLTVRRPHPWQTNQVYILRRRGCFLLGFYWSSTLSPQYGGQHSRRDWPRHNLKWETNKSAATP